MDRQNRWIYEANKDRPLAAVLAESRAFFRRLEGLLSRLPEPVLRESAAISWLPGWRPGAPLWRALAGVECVTRPARSESLTVAGRWGNAHNSGRRVPRLLVAQFVG